MPVESYNSEPAVRKPNVCLVDDDDIMLSLFLRIVERSGCDVVTAKGPEAAAKLLASTPVDLIISDHRMPDMVDGEGLLNLVHETYPQLAITMMSCDFTADAHTRLVAAGATACVAKPLTVDCVAGLVDALDNPALSREPLKR